MRPLRSAVPLAALLALACVPPALSADLQITLPNVNVTPGSQIAIAIDVSANPTPFGVYAIDFRMPLNPAVVSSSASQANGFLQSWGPPYVNANTSFIAAATGGASALSTSSTRLNTIVLNISSSAVVGTDMPLTFSTIRFNEGSPSIAVIAGNVHISGSADAPAPGEALAFTLATPAPNPARSGARFSLTLPRAGHATLALHAVDGARVRTLADRELVAGLQDLAWDGRDDRGRTLPAGLYFARLTWSGQSAVRRIVLAR